MMDIKTKIIEKILFLLSFSLKKIYPKRTLIIGIIKYPKLASIILSEATAYIHIDQLTKIKKPDINNAINFFLFLISLKKIFHFNKNEVVIINIIAVHKHLCTTNSV